MAKKTHNATESIALSAGQRSKVLLETTLKVGTKKLRNKFSRHSLKTTKEVNSRIEQIAQDNLEQGELAEIVFQGLCKLRGTAMKIAQYISSDQDLLTPEHLEVLRQSHYQVPPLNTVIVSKMIRNEFKVSKEDLFAFFEDKAFAAASLGQVHRAKTLDGKDIAVKIQYPGIDQTISVDLGIVKKILSVVPKNKFILNSLHSIEQHLYEEVDYWVEQKNALDFYNFFCGNTNTHIEPNFIIPRVLPQLSSQRVITYEFIQGQSLQDWLRSNPSQQQRDQLGQNLWQFFFDSAFKLQKIHADPNWGNFLMTESNQLAILDFGCIQSLSLDAVKLFHSLFLPEDSITISELVSLYVKLGAKVDLSNPHQIESFYENAIRPYRHWLTKLIYKEIAYENMHLNKIEKLSTEGQRILFREIFSSYLDSFSNEFTLLHRTFFGLLKIIESIKADLSKEFKLSAIRDSS